MKLFLYRVFVQWKLKLLSFLMNSVLLLFCDVNPFFVPINLHRCRPREWKRSMKMYLTITAYNWWKTRNAKKTMGVNARCLLRGRSLVSKWFLFLPFWTTFKGSVVPFQFSSVYVPRSPCFAFRLEQIRPRSGTHHIACLFRHALIFSVCKWICFNVATFFIWEI